MRLLVVDDDEMLADLLGTALRREGHAVDAVGTGAEALWIADEVDFDVVILDWGLPDVPGVEVCRRLREKAQWVPVLMLTGRNQVEDRVSGLDAGADDYLVKPFDVQELLARVRALGRRDTGARPTVLAVGDLEVDPGRRTACRAGTALELTAKEFSLLELLARADGTVVSRDDLIAGLWDFASDPDPNVLDVHIRNLRKKLDKPFDRPLIHTVRGVGYRLAVT